ncbi:MarR family transcriptional regulator [Polyangium aurulentum]|nr:MarR family transcriptional regulator [Polyangium aurulentum]
MDAIRRLVRFLRLASRAAEAHTGVSGAQLFVVQSLAEGPVSSMAELAARTLTDPSSVSTVVARLVDRGLVARHPSREDRRRVEIALTAKGRAVVEHAPELAQHRILAAIAKMPAARRRSLARTFEELVREIGAETIEPKMFFEDEPPSTRETKKKPATKATKTTKTAKTTKKAPAAKKKAATPAARRKATTRG